MSSKATILVVDDEPNTLEVIERNLSPKGYRVLTAQAVAEALGIIDSEQVDLVITDLKMPKASGLDLVKHVRENFRGVEIMMITGYATIEGAVEAVKAGAQEYLTKPFTDDELETAVRRALDRLKLRRAGHTKLAVRPLAMRGLIGDSPAMQEVLEAISKASTSLATVLISGESGTGKELVARAIHYSSPRAAAPFVPVNSSGIPESLMESELFGYVKGAFTGAAESRAGFFQTADGGSLFLDEIGETSPGMQAKLLRVLQDQEFYMVGSSRAKKANVRILAATNKDLLAQVKKGAFREDLYYRVNVISIVVPPLRERGDDVLQLINHFAAKFAAEQGKPIPELSDGTLRALTSYTWPGNIRELQNLIQRLVVMTNGDVIDLPELPAFMRYSASRETSLDRTLAQVEMDHISKVLHSVGGNKTRAAEILGIDRKTLREKLKLLKKD